MTVFDDEVKRTNWVNALHQQGIGLSAVQEALVNVLSNAERPLTVAEIWQKAQQVRPETGRATVFRFIDKLTTAGLLHRVHGYRNCGTYIPALDQHQPFLLCTSCGHVSYLDRNSCDSVTKAVEATKRELEDHHVTGYQLQLFEVCITCQLDES